MDNPTITEPFRVSDKSDNTRFRSPLGMLGRQLLTTKTANFMNIIEQNYINVVRFLVSCLMAG